MTVKCHTAIPFRFCDPTANWPPKLFHNTETESYLFSIVISAHTHSIAKEGDLTLCVVVARTAHRLEMCLARLPEFKAVLPTDTLHQLDLLLFILDLADSEEANLKWRIISVF